MRKCGDSCRAPGLSGRDKGPCVSGSTPKWLGVVVGFCHNYISLATKPSGKA